MRDLIDRQALIKELHRWDMQDLYLPAHFQHLIEDAPSAETYVIADEARMLYTEADDLIDYIIALRLAGKEDEQEMANNNFAMEKFVTQTKQFISWMLEKL